VRDIPFLSEGQKARLQELLIVILQRKDFSEASYEQTWALVHDIIAAPYTEKMQAVSLEAAELAREVQGLFGKYGASMTGIAAILDEGLEKKMEPASLLAGVRDTLRTVISQMEKDTVDLLSQTRKDFLTGLANRRAFDQFMEESVTLWREKNIPLSLIMLDIDYFKNLNDTYGHMMGDQVLRIIGRQLNKIAKSLKSEQSTVLAARYGGEEFALVLRGEATSRAALVADNMRRTIQKTTLSLNDGSSVVNSLRVTVSIGVADMWSGWRGAHVANLVDSADKALYYAKKNGRNCTAQYTPGQASSFALINRG
jgi:diguanylate cyclase (GGDEF)-like protein